MVQRSAGARDLQALRSVDKQRTHFRRLAVHNASKYAGSDPRTMRASLLLGHLCGSIQYLGSAHGHKRRTQRAHSRAHTPITNDQPPHSVVYSGELLRVAFGRPKPGCRTCLSEPLNSFGCGIGGGARAGRIAAGRVSANNLVVRLTRAAAWPVEPSLPRCDRLTLPKSGSHSGFFSPSFFCGVGLRGGQRASELAGNNSAARVCAALRGAP